MTPQPKPNPIIIKGRHVLLGLIAFFGIMLLANAIFLYLAVTTHSGGDTSNAYQKGLHYNATLEAAKEQAAGGWKNELAYDDETGRLTLKVLDQATAPITGLHVGAKLGRPATDREDRRVVLKETVEGTYAATLDLTPGTWVVAIASRRDGEGPTSAFRLKRRLVVAETP
jgi:nitrogen fixation protein FixH